MENKTTEKNNSSKKLKIAILTFWWSNDNYGQQLQAYALQKYLRDLGHDAFLIKYDYRKDIKQTPLYLRLFKAMNPVKLIGFIVYKIRSNRKKSILQAEALENPRHFDEFREKYIIFTPEEYNTLSELKANPPDADVYIVGSDQVWNFWSYKAKKIPGRIHAYFLDFGNSNVKRISYAASWGKSILPIDHRNEIAPIIKKFDFITVREKSGIEVCKSFGVDSEWVCDPTLLLDADVYRKLYKNGLGEKEPYIKPYLLFYYLDNGGEFDKESVYKFAKNHNLEVQYVSGNSCIDPYKKNFATVPEWLSLIDNAEYVITNSFHCCVFSILFDKKLGAIKMTGKNKGMNERFESLFEMTGCGERYVTDEDFSVLGKEYRVDVDFPLRKKSMDVLKEILEKNYDKW